MSEELSELGYEEFVRARKSYWQQEAKNAGNDAALPDKVRASDGEDTGNFMLYSPGPEGTFAVFEDTDQAGALPVFTFFYGVKQRQILKHAHIYSRGECGC